MYILNATTKKIQVKLGGAVTTNELDCTAHFATHSAISNTPVEFDVSTNGAAAVDVVAAPGASEEQMVSAMTIYNADTVPAEGFIQLNNNGTLRTLANATLATGETLSYEHGGDWRIRTAAGDTRVVTGADVDATFITQVPAASLPNSQPLSALDTGLMQVTNATGEVSSVAKTASSIPTVDAGGYYVSADIEANLQEAGYNVARALLGLQQEGLSAGYELTIPVGHQILVYGEYDCRGDLTIEGNLVIL